MNWLPTNEVLQRRANVVLIVLFLAFIFLPMADTFLHLDRAPSPNENRAPAAFPVLDPNLDGTRKFIAGVEAYFGDHFGFRRQLIRWEQSSKWRLFHDERASKVLVGRDGWLFFSDGRTVDDISGTMPFTGAELESWHTLLTGRRDWLRERGIRYLLVIPPDKQSIYPEHLPDWLLARARKPQRLDQFLTYMRAHSDVPILDLREALLDAKMIRQVYLRTDSHWNERGAFAAYRRIVQEISALGIPATAPDRGEFSETLTDEPGGDLAFMLGQQGTLPETAIPVLSPKPPLQPVEARVQASADPKKRTPVSAPLISENPLATGKVVMFRDSFAIALSKFFGHSFGRVAYVWQQNWDKPFIEREKPDIVIDEMVEHFLIFRDPDDLRKKDEQPDAHAITNP